MNNSIDIPSTSDGDVLTEKYKLNNENQVSEMLLDPIIETDKFEYTDKQKEELRMVSQGVRPKEMPFSVFKKLRSIDNTSLKIRLKGNFEHLSRFADEKTGEVFGVTYKKEKK